jgi:hypothetical protein
MILAYYVDVVIISEYFSNGVIWYGGVSVFSVIELDFSDRVQWRHFYLTCLYWFCLVYCAVPTPSETPVPAPTPVAEGPGPVKAPASSASTLVPGVAFALLGAAAFFF